MLEIPRLTELTRQDFVRNYLRPQVPFILTGEASQWPAVGKWSLDYLAETHLDHRVLVEFYPTQQRNHAYTYVEMTVGEYVQRIKSDPDARHTYYIADTSVESTLPEIKDDIRVPSIIQSDRGMRSALFFGCDTFSTAHYHRFRQQALLAQVVGSKDVLLYPAKHLKHTYPNPWYGLRSNFSSIEMEFDNVHPEPEEYPNFTNADEYRCTVNAGEMLFIPDHWMHTVLGPGENVTVTYFWPESVRDCYLPGVVRDAFAYINKMTLTGIARIGKPVGLHRLLLNLAVRLGIVPSDEREAVLQHLEVFDGKLPGNVKQESMDTAVERNSAPTSHDSEPASRDSAPTSRV